MAHPPSPTPIRLAAPCLSAMLLWDCAVVRHAGPGSVAKTDSTVFHVPSPESSKNGPVRTFQEYQSGTGWDFTATGPSWLEVPAEKSEKGYPVRTLVRNED